MQNNTSNQTPQPTNQPMSHGDAKASMGIATFLQSHLLPQGQPTAQTTAQTTNPAPQPPSNQQNPTDVNEQIQALEGRVMDEMSQLKEEIRKVGEPKDQNKEILDLKNQLEAILNES